MTDSTVSNVHPLVTKKDAFSALSEMVRDAARRMLQVGLGAEADEYIHAHADQRDENGHRVVKRNGHQPERVILTGAGPLRIKRPHIRVPREGLRSLAPYYRATCDAVPR